MSLENLAKSLEDYRAAQSDSKRFRYPQNLKSHAIRYYKANPDLTPGKLAKILGISPAAGDRWFRGVRQKPSTPKQERKRRDFIELKPTTEPKIPKTNKSPDIKVRIIEVTVPMGDEGKVLSALNAIIRG